MKYWKRNSIKVIKKVKKSEMCSASDNTTQEVSHKDQMTIIRCYLDEKQQPKERLLSLKPEASKREVRSNFLDNEELVFQSYDFTNFISGHLGGARRNLQDKLDRSITYIFCQSDHCNTVVEHSVNRSAVISNLCFPY